MQQFHYININIAIGFGLLGIVIWMLALQSTLIVQCQDSQYWVRPNISVDCPRGVDAEHCVLLSDIAKNSSKFFTNNTTIHFMGGVHTITSGVDSWISVTGSSILASPVQNISISGSNGGESAIILCQTVKIGFAFYDVKNVSLSGLTIRNCGFNVRKTKQHDYLRTMPHIYASLYIVYVLHLNLGDIIIEESIGIGLLAVTLGGNTTIENSVFQYNTNKPHKGMDGQVSGGNAYLILTPLVKFTSSINISNSLFAHSFIASLAPLFKCCEFCETAICNIHQSAGLNIYMEALSKTHIFVHNTTFNNNSAPMGANLLITLFHHFTTLITPIKFTADNSTFSKGKATQYSGGGIYLSMADESSRTNTLPRKKFNCIIVNSTFVGNIAKADGGAIAIKTSLFTAYTAVQISNNVFTGNEAKSGAGINIELQSVSRLDWGSLQYIVIAKNLFNLNRASRYGGAIATTTTVLGTGYNIYYYLIDSVFIGNSANTGSGVHLSYFHARVDISLGSVFIKQISNCTFTQNLVSGTRGNELGSVIYLENIEDLLTSDIRIDDNNCRGIQANMSSIAISQNIRISNNSGTGIFLMCYPLTKLYPMSHLTFADFSSLYIQDNHAQSFGGGIVVQSGCSVPELCFFKLPPNFNESTPQVVHMSGNNAGIAGTSIYGGNLENCYLESTSTWLSPQMFWSIFNISTANTQPSVVASQAYKVCICTINFNTSRSCEFDYNVRVYPGEPFYVPVVGVGQYNYSSPSVIRATIANEYTAAIPDQQVTQEVNILCKNLTYTLQTQDIKVTIQLSIEVPFGSDSTLPDLQCAIVNATILDCPLGFELYENSSACDCIDYLTRNGITCNILDQTVHRTAFMWIGNDSNDILVVHHNCPFDYCNQTVLDFSLYTQEEQCSFNRTGVLCGACQPGYSLVLGTSLCSTECSNIYLLLLLPILMAGLVLVALLLKCNLTVSTGTINGLIFYANIIQVNNKVFFPNTNVFTTSYILSVFIAWINLDLGIEVCFAHDLDTYSRTWLQFLFPIYIWLLVGLLILVCRYSVTVTRLSGHYTVSVLATLFLLSYAKLLRTTLGIFSPTILTDPRGEPHLVWLLDGNYEFLQWPHLAIFLAALVTLVVYLLPFTLLVLLGPTIQAHSEYKLLRWVTKFKPFLDAYQGPYKTKYRYWTGVMLLARILLYVVFAGNALEDPSINLLTIMLAVLVLLIVWVKVGRVYRKSPLNTLELFYLVNLGVTTGVTTYLRNTSGDNLQSQAILTGIMVGSTLIVFMSTLIYHCYSETVQSRLWKRFKETAQTVRSRKLQDQSEVDQEVEESIDSVQIQPNSPTRTVVSLREALLVEH